MSAITGTTQFDNPIDLLLDVCGETVYLSGVIRTLFHVTQINNQTLVKIQSKPEGLTGTGLTSGVIYQGVGVTQSVVRFVEDFPIEATAVNNFRMISRGSTDNLQVHETIHFTINANGDMTAYVDNFSVKCNG